MRILARAAAATLAGGLALAAGVLSAFADDIEIPEAAVPVVGMALDSSNDELWLAGPAADRATLLEAAGDKEVSFNAELESVQALAWYGDRLWVGDIGDVEGSREFIVVYRLGSTEGGRTTYHAYDFRYEDGARHAEAMLISGRGNIYFVSAGEDPGIYRVRGEARRDRVNTLERVEDAPEGVTDGVFLSDGSTMALRSATGIEYIDALVWEPLATETLVGAPEAESITRSADDEVYVGGNPAVRVGEVPNDDVTTTVAPAVEESPSPSPSAPDPSEPAASEPAEAPDAVDEGPARSGTITAVVLAGVVAVAAGVVTYYWRN